MASKFLATLRTNGGTVSVARFMLTGAIASAVFFALCWVGALLPIGPATHAYLELFAAAPAASALALGQGLCWSAVFGAAAGGLIGLIYNLLGALDRR